MNKIREFIYNNEKLINFIDDNIIMSVIAPDGKVLYQSPSVYRIMGFSPDELEGKNVTDIVHPEDVKKIFLKLEDAIDNQNYDYSYEYVYRGLQSSGNYRHLKSYGKLVKIEDDFVAIILSIDITTEIDLKEELVKFQRLLQSILDATREIIILINAEYKILFLNKAGEKLLEKISTDIYKNSLLAILKEYSFEMDYEYIERIFEVVKETRHYKSFSMKIKSNYFNCDLYPVLNFSNEFENYVLYAQDQTNQKKMESEILERAKDIEKLIEAGMDHVFLADITGKVIIISDHASKKYLGHSSENIIGNNYFDFIRPPEQKRRLRFVEKVIHTGQSISVIEEHLAPDGITYIFDLNIVPIKNENGEIDRLAVYAKNITERQQLEEEKEEMRNELFRLLFGSLSKKEQLLLKELSENKSNKMIAHEWQVTDQTVMNTKKRAKEKLNLINYKSLSDFALKYKDSIYNFFN